MASQQGQPKYGFGWPVGRLGGLGPPGSTTPVRGLGNLVVLTLASLMYVGVWGEVGWVLSAGGINYDSLIVRTVAFPVQVAYWI